VLGSSQSELLEAVVTSVGYSDEKPTQDEKSWRKVIRVDLSFKGVHHRAARH
jgi:hypothetical protein